MSAPTIWVIGAEDDHLEAAFTTEDAAQAYLAKLQERDGTVRYDHWWIEEIDLDPDAPRPISVVVDLSEARLDYHMVDSDGHRVPGRIRPIPDGPPWREGLDDSDDVGTDMSKLSTRPYSE